MLGEINNKSKVKLKLEWNEKVPPDHYWLRISVREIANNIRVFLDASWWIVEVKEPLQNSFFNWWSEIYNSTL